MKLNLILTTIMQEKQRVEYMLAKYLEEHAHLPKGSISEKRVGEKTYYYLKYRKGEKVISQYISKSVIDDVRVQVEKRKHIEIMIKLLRDELGIVDRILEENYDFISRQQSSGSKT